VDVHLDDLKAAVGREELLERRLVVMKGRVTDSHVAAIASSSAGNPMRQNALSSAYRSGKVALVERDDTLFGGTLLRRFWCPQPEPPEAAAEIWLRRNSEPTARGFLTRTTTRISGTASSRTGW
jgi:hypothetical protein